MLPHNIHVPGSHPKERIEHNVFSRCLMRTAIGIVVWMTNHENWHRKVLCGTSGPVFFILETAKGYLNRYSRCAYLPICMSQWHDMTTLAVNVTEPETRKKKCGLIIILRNEEVCFDIHFKGFVLMRFIFVVLKSYPHTCYKAQHSIFAQLGIKFYFCGNESSIVQLRATGSFVCFQSTLTSRFQ